MSSRKYKKVNLLKDQMFLTKKYVDTNDPIYDSEEEDENCFYTVVNAEEIEHSQKIANIKKQMINGPRLLTFEEYEKKCDAMISNFFETYNMQLVVDEIKAIDMKQYNDYFVLQLIKRSFDHDDECHSNVSCLLNILDITKLITTEQVYRGFEKILFSLEDIKLDTPACYEIFLNYLRFSILDNIIDESYIYKLPIFFFDNLDIQSLDKQARELAKEYAEDMKTGNEEASTTIGNKLLTKKKLEVDKSELKGNYSLHMDKGNDTRKTKEEIWKETLLWLLDLDILQKEKEKKQFREETRKFLAEFFNDGDSNLVVEYLSNSDRLFHHEFVRISIIESFSKNNICRKMISYILDTLCEHCISKDDIIIGFIRIVGNITDYEIDCPQASEFVCKFLLRCIYDDVLYPSFLSDCYRLHIGGEAGMSICNKTRISLNDKKQINFNTIDFIWNEDDRYEQMKIRRKINNTLLEYFYSYIEEEECYLYFDEFLPTKHDFCKYIVKKIFIFNLDINNDTKLSLKLLNYLIKKKVLTECDVENGIKDILDSLEDILLDIPKFPIEMEKVMLQLLSCQLVSSEFCDSAMQVFAKHKMDL